MFLARFVANKFRRSYALRDVLNPLVKELSRVTKSYNFRSQRIKTDYIKANEIFIKKEGLKRVWGLLFGMGDRSYKKNIFSLFEKGNTWFTLDIILFYAQIRRLTYITYKQTLQIFSQFTNRLSGFWLANLSDIGAWYVDISNYSIKDKAVPLEGLPSYEFESFFTKHIRVSPTLFNRLPTSATLTSQSVLVTSRSYSNFLKFNYFEFNHKLFSLVKTVNYMHSRLNELKRDFASNLFKGFKIHCLGRFSRRQKAKSYWVQAGTVPVNSFKENVDYGNYTVPIRNSLISIKV